MSRELRSFVDEEDDQEDEFGDKPPEAKETDWDRIFAYKTYKIVRIKDRQLGLLYWGIVTLVILYIIIFALGIEGKHQYQEPGIGTVVTKFHGKGFANKKAYDAGDLRFPEIEPFGAFIMTREIKVLGQKKEECVDFDNPCPCKKGHECVDGFCKGKAWCPSLGDGNAEEAEGAIDTAIKGLENTIVEINAGIAFPGIGNHFFVAGKISEPSRLPGQPVAPKLSSATNEFKNITLKDLLSRAMPPVKFEEVLETGALIGVSFYWKCDVSDLACQPAVVVKRLDNGKGFIQKRAYHHSTGRDVVLMYGLRILVESSGIGRQFSFVLLVIQIGSCLALLRTASMAADFMMLQLYPKERRDAYYNCKVLETQDFSDMQDRINVIRDAQAEDSPFLKVHLRDAEEQAHAHENFHTSIHGEPALSLGPGGKGGLAHSILRPRTNYDI